VYPGYQRVLRDGHGEIVVHGLDGIDYDLC
jgi:hypothetical protein